MVSLLGLAVVVPSTLSRAASAQSPVVGHVYVNSNTARQNSIDAFDRHADGMLTSMPGSPFATGGAGTGEVIGSQDAVRITPDGRYLLAVAAGSNEISVLRIEDDGALTPVEGSPFPSGGLVPVSIALTGGTGLKAPITPDSPLIVAASCNHWMAQPCRCRPRRTPEPSSSMRPARI